MLEQHPISLFSVGLLTRAWGEAGFSFANLLCLLRENPNDQLTLTSSGHHAHSGVTVRDSHPVPLFSRLVHFSVRDGHKEVRLLFFRQLIVDGLAHRMISVSRGTNTLYFHRKYGW